MEDKMSSFEKVQEIVADKLGVEKTKITPEASFIDDLGADSLDTVELIMKMEEEFGIEIPDEEAEKLKTVGDVVNYLDNLK
jgi:acyl carrier protein